MLNSSDGVAVQVRSGMHVITITTGTGYDPQRLQSTFQWNGGGSKAWRSKADFLPVALNVPTPARQANPAAVVLRVKADEPRCRAVALAQSWALLCAHFGTRGGEAPLLPYSPACILHPPRSRPSSVGPERRYIMREWRATRTQLRPKVSKRSAGKSAKTRWSLHRRAGSLGSQSGTWGRLCPMCIGTVTWCRLYVLKASTAPSQAR